MELRHIRLDYDDAFYGKKELLNSELNILTILKRFKSYQLLRRKESIAKSKLRNQLQSIKVRIKNLDETIPTKKISKSKEKKKTLTRDKESRGIQEELDEIRRKLEELG